MYVGLCGQQEGAQEIWKVSHRWKKIWKERPRLEHMPLNFPLDPETGEKDNAELNLYTW